MAALNSESVVEKRERKENFSHKEILALLDAFSLNKGILQSKLKASLSLKQKNDAWEVVVEAVNAVSFTVRSKQEIQTKWQKLCSDARTHLAQKKGPKTGGGPQPKEGPYTSIIADIIGADSELTFGVGGGIDTGDVIEDSRDEDMPDCDTFHFLPVGTREQSDHCTQSQANDSRSSTPLTSSSRRLFHVVTDSHGFLIAREGQFRGSPEPSSTSSSTTTTRQSSSMVVPERGGKRRFSPTTASHDLYEAYLKKGIELKEMQMKNLALKNEKLELEIKRLKTEDKN